ncbi:SLC13 family permease [Aliifodinibius sp. S!AR15-10]|uniref:SLC13 family permease n=1 Tax=Aliifodinibius sp. S!AR15-10 TaxID=2950437 RepID=UPI0028653E80|nr:SLC13 family permease [Aliifodinibius sp. S!AR15-10]MDR8394344.1 SLC13 family permease [Aliifodinibius sp. S!AR15-10]
MGFEQLLIFGVLLFAFIGLAIDLWSPDAILLTALAVLTISGVLSLEQAFQGFANTTIIALGSLYVVSAAMRESGALDRASSFILGRETRSIQRILLRLCPSVSLYSAFLNNTPVVAMGIPTIRRWALKNNIIVSKLLMPLSFAAIFGGLCTLIGTSTNLITHGLLQSHGFEGLSFFELAWVGVPCAVVGLLYLIFISPLLTPARRDIRYEEERRRNLLVEIEVTEGADVIGETIKDTNLGEFQGFYLSRINRRDREIAPVPKDEKLRRGDHLLYAAKGGIAAKLPDLADYSGLQVIHHPPRDIEQEEKPERELHQVVVKEGSPLVGSTVEEAKLLERFGAAVTGVRRRGRRVDQPLGSFVLHPGDVLLLDTRLGFREAYEDTKDFFLTSAAGGEASGAETSIEEHRSEGKDLYISVAVLVGIVSLVATGLVHIALAGILGVAVLLSFNVIKAGEARKSVDWTVLIVIGAAIGLGKAMEVSGTAELIARWMVDLTSAYGHRTVLAGVVIVTGLLTEIITNNGAVALMFPIALSVAETQGVEARGLFIAITLVASMSLITPIGYQTNLMVYGPGNYRFTDFFKVGFPLELTLWTLVIILVPIFWPM